MGARGREDTDPTANRSGTEPGLGKASGPTPAASAAPAPTVDDDGPPPVDFDALHAALGDPLDYQEMGSSPALERGASGEDLLDGIEAAGEELPTGPGVRVGESSGRSSATYASARPHTIPPTRAPLEDPNAPAVIVASDTDTVPSAPPQMTVPLSASPHAGQFAAGGLLPGGAPLGVPGSNPHIGAAAGSGPHGAAPGHPSSGPHPASAALGPGYPHTPQPIPVQARGGPQMTIRMPDRPVVNARRGKTPTIVVRRRGPSTKQKLLAFMAMLLLVTVCGIAVIIWRKPRWLGLDSLGGAPSATTSGVAPSPTSGTLGAPSASSGSGSGPTLTPVTPLVPVTPLTPGSGTPGTAAGGSASASPSASASAKKVVKVPPPPLPPPPHPLSSAPSSRL
jgi:hypothetical protein